MFKHILIPTDGSPRSARAIKAGLRLALETGARITGYYAADPVEREAAS
jgi:nucleotide-binding universal stress UspA family protein